MMSDHIPRKHWLVIPLSRVYIDYKRWIQVTKDPNPVIGAAEFGGVHRVHFKSRTSSNHEGYLVWISQKKIDDQPYLQYTCECPHFTQRIYPRLEKQYQPQKTSENAESFILVEDWHNLDKHAYISAQEVLKLRIQVALPLYLQADFGLIKAGRYKKRMEEKGVTSLLELMKLEKTPDVDLKVLEIIHRAKQMFEKVDIIENTKGSFVAASEFLLNDQTPS